MQRLRRRLAWFRDEMRIPARARRERRSDRAGLPATDPGVDRVIEEGVAWLARGQEHSASQDGGVAREFSLIGGWASSYPETTGYIVPSLLDYAAAARSEAARARARRMLDWLVSIQLPQGGFFGGCVDSTPLVPVSFNTGQILIGLAAGSREFGVYRDPLRRAADWLATSLDADGCWRRYPSPFVKPGEKAYDTHAAWGLFEAARVIPDSAYADAGIANVRWALTNLRENGWVAQCCIDDPAHPLTHTLGYFLRGVVEAYRYSKDPALLSAAKLTADGLLHVLRDDGLLAGRLNPDWSPAVDWVCLTGSIQIAHCWLMLFGYTGEERYRDAGYRANQFVRRTIKVDGPDEIRGAVKGAFPVDGGYLPYEYLSWGTKFSIDANMLEREIRRRTDSSPLRSEGAGDRAAAS